MTTSRMHDPGSAAGKILLAVALSILLVSLSPAAQDPSDEDRIRTARAGFNAAIAAHDVEAIVSFLDTDYQITTSLGQMSLGREQEAASWTELFAAREDVTYVRSPETVTVSERYPLAAESGSWTGTWSTGNGTVSTGGSYAAMWRLVDGAWKVRSELFVALYCEGADCP